MKRLILILFLLFGFGLAQAQGLEGFKGNNGKFGFKDASGKVIVEPKYDHYENFSDGLCVVNTGSEWSDDPGALWPEGGKWGYINEKGVEVIPLIYDATRTFSEGMGVFAIIGSDGKYKYGYLDTRGEIIVPAEYSFAEDFENGYGRVMNGEEMHSFVDKTGKLIFPFKYSSVIYLMNERFALGLDNPTGEKYIYGLADAKGNLLTEIKYSYIFDYKDGIAKAFIGQGADQISGFLDMGGKEVIPVIYGSLDTFDMDGLRTAKLNGKWGMLDEKGKEVIPFMYDSLVTYKAYEGRVIVKIGSNYGIIDLKNEVILPLKYEGLKIFTKDLNILGVKSDGKWGFMDYTGKILVEPQFDIMDNPVMDKEEAFARVSKDKKYFHIDSKGNKVE